MKTMTVEEIIESRKKWLTKKSIQDWNNTDTVFVMEKYAKQQHTALIEENERLSSDIEVYKQDWKTLNDENTEYRQRLEENVKSIDSMLYYNSELEKENERLKTTVELRNKTIDLDTVNIIKLNQENDRLQKEVDGLKLRCSKLLPELIELAMTGYKKLSEGSGHEEFLREDRSTLTEARELLKSLNTPKP